MSPTFPQFRMQQENVLSSPNCKVATRSMLQDLFPKMHEVHACPVYVCILDDPLVKNHSIHKHLLLLYRLTARNL